MLQHLSAKQIIYTLERPVKHGLSVKRRLERRARVVDLLAALRLAQNAFTRALLCEILGRRKAKSAVPDLIASLNDQDAYLRSEAAQALAKIGASSAGPALVSQMAIEPDGGVRQMFIIALGAIDYHDAEPLFIPMLADSDPMIRGVAAWSLGALHAEQAKDALQAALTKETDSYPQARIQAALVEIVGRRA